MLFDNSVFLTNSVTLNKALPSHTKVNVKMCCQRKLGVLTGLARVAVRVDLL